MIDKDLIQRNLDYWTEMEKKKLEAFLDSVNWVPGSDQIEEFDYRVKRFEEWETCVRVIDWLKHWLEPKEES